jgi:hypothetical protein
MPSVVNTWGRQRGSTKPVGDVLWQRPLTARIEVAEYIERL